VVWHQQVASQLDMDGSRIGTPTRATDEQFEDKKR
jgi:hypothetical protein